MLYFAEQLTENPYSAYKSALMKTITIITVFALAMSFFTACGPTADPTQSTEKDLKIYTTSREAGDMGTALVAAYNILYASDSNYTYYDTIAQIYSDMGNPQGAFNMAEAGLEKHSSLLLDKVMAQANKDLGNYAVAVDQFNALIKADAENTLSYQYSMGESYFLLEDFKACVEQMDQIIANEKSTVQEKILQTKNGSQRVSYNLAAMNIVAYVMMVQGEYDMAEKVLTEVLTQKEDFELAYNNYSLLQQLKSRKK